MNRLTLTTRQLPMVLLGAGMVGLLFFGTDAFAKEGQNIGKLAENIKESFSELAKIVTAGAYIAGFGFAMSAILKFKQHKDNPTQIPIGTPIALLFIAAALLFIPSIFGSAGQTIFKSDGKVGGVKGVDEFGYTGGS